MARTLGGHHGLLSNRPADYDPISGRWLTYDSVWNERDPNAYTFCGGDPIGYFDADGRGFWGTFFSGAGHDLYATGATLVNGVVQAGAIGSDMIGQSAASAFGYGANYQGYSQLYQNIYNNPSSGPTASGVLLGTVNAELNVVTFGGASVVEGGYTAYQTGNYSQLQTSFAGIALAGGAATAYGRLTTPSFSTGAAGEAYIRGVTGGETGDGIMTSQGMRYPDVVDDTAMTEVKVGYVNYSQQVLTQISKDSEIVENQLEGIQSGDWQFLQSSVTGGVGADPRVLAALDEAGLSYTINNGSANTLSTFNLVNSTLNPSTRTGSGIDTESGVILSTH